MSLDALILIVASLSGLILSMVATRWLASHAGARLGRLDHPNERSLHQTPVPRTGGLGVLLGTIVAWILLALFGQGAADLSWLAAAMALVAGVSFLDDLGHLHPGVRLSAHVLAAMLLICGGLGWHLIDLPGLTLAVPVFAWVGLTILLVVWMINLYNFMDGMDGFAGGMAVFGFGALAALGWLGGEPGYAAAALGIASAAAGFLTINFPPARIFLGDVGSSTLGLLGAGFSLWGAELGLFPLWTAALAFSPFIVDATWTLLARLAKGERIWEPHRSHHYQRLVLAGWGHRKTLLRSYLVMAGAAACAVASPDLATREQWMLLGAWAIIYFVIHLRVGLIERLALPDRSCTQ